MSYKLSKPLKINNQTVTESSSFLELMIEIAPYKQLLVLHFFKNLLNLSS